MTSHMESVCLCMGSGGDQSHGECVSVYGEWRLPVTWRVSVYVWGVEVTSHMESVCLCMGSGGDQSHGECVSVYGEWR